MTNENIEIIERIKIIIQEKIGSKHGAYALFADYVGVSRSIISTYMKFSQPPGMKTLIKIAEKCDLNIRWLLYGEPTKYRIHQESCVSELETSYPPPIEGKKAILARLKKIISAICGEDTGANSLFAKKLNVNRSTITSLFLRESMPSADLLLKISSAFGISIDYILSGIGNMYLSQTPKNTETPTKTGYCNQKNTKLIPVFEKMIPQFDVEDIQKIEVLGEIFESLPKKRQREIQKAALDFWEKIEENLPVQKQETPVIDIITQVLPNMKKSPPR